MKSPPMPRRETALALVAVVLAAGTMLPVATVVRLACGGAAAAVVGVLLVTRLRAHRFSDSSSRSDAVYRRLAEIRQRRADRRRIP